MNLVAFIAVMLAVNLTPGPAMLHCVSVGAQRGIRAGLAACLGVESGVFLYVLATAFGLAAVLQSSTLAYDVIRVAGIGFLFYLAVTNLPRRSDTDDEMIVRDISRPYLRGFILNASNPKIGIFFLTLLPQIVPAAEANTVRLLACGLAFNLSGLIINGSAAALGHRLGRTEFVARKGVRNTIAWVPPIVFGALGAYELWAVTSSLI